MEFTVLYIACEERAFIVVVGTIRTTAKTRNPPRRPRSETPDLSSPYPTPNTAATEWSCSPSHS